MLLLRREGLELALYSFRYLKDVKQVVVLIPATPGKAQTIALYFSRDELRPELDRPLTSSLLPTAPTTKTVTLSPDARLVDQTTNPYLFSLMGSSFNDRGYLVLDPYSPPPIGAAEAPQGAAEAGRGRAARRRGLDAPVLGRLSSAARDKLARAKARLDTLDLYPRPVRMRRVRLVSAPWLFRLPWFRRFDGYTMWDLILVRAPVADVGDDLVTHELCHVWQMQHHPLAMPLSYLYRGYSDNPNEVAGAAGRPSSRPARSASACATRAASSASCGRAAARSSRCASARRSTRVPEVPARAGDRVPRHEPGRRSNGRRRSLRSSTSMDRRWPRS
jgi:hypothetical protein